jgi:hypothetical protein
VPAGERYSFLAPVVDAALDLICQGNSPAAQIGDSGGGPNIVGGNAIGECASLAD